MSQTLYEIGEEYRAALAVLAAADVPPEVVFDTVEGLQGELNDKVEAVVSYARNLQASADARAAEAKRMKESAEVLERKAENLMTYAQIVLTNTGVRLPLVLPRFTLNLAKNPPSCDIVKEDDLPSMYRPHEVVIKVLLHDQAVSIDQVREQLPDSLKGATIDIKPKVDKVDLLRDLKQVAEVNAAKATGEAPDRIPGARLNPTSYRLTVK